MRPENAAPAAFRLSSAAPGSPSVCSAAVNPLPRKLRRVALLAALGAVLAPPLACAPRLANTPDLNLPLPEGSPDAAWATRTPTERERREILAAFESLAGAEHQPPPKPVDAPLRWADIDRAVREALPRAGAAILRTHLEPADAKHPLQAARITYEVITLDDEPGRLVVERCASGRTYIASARVGLLADRRDRSERILDALAVAMRAYAATPAPREPRSEAETAR